MIKSNLQALLTSSVVALRCDCQSSRDFSKVVSFFGFAAAAKLDRDFLGFAVGLGLGIVVGGVTTVVSTEDERGGLTRQAIGAGVFGGEEAVVVEAFSEMVWGNDCLDRHSFASFESSATSTFSLDKRILTIKRLA